MLRRSVAALVLAGLLLTGCAPSCPSTGDGHAVHCSVEGARDCLGGSDGWTCRAGCWRFEHDLCRPSPGSDAGSDASTDARLVEAGARDASGDLDAPGSGSDAAIADVGAGDTGADASVPDAGADAGMPDAGMPDAGPPDAGVPAMATYCVDIDVSNTCMMSVSPREITIPAGQTAYFCWRNRSVDYPVDVWLSYGGGYTDLAPGATWNEPPGHCLGPLVHDEYADISTACSSFRFLIHCL